MSELKLDQNQAVSILIALINQGKIELPCLKEFNKFREWELSQSMPDGSPRCGISQNFLRCSYVGEDISG